MAMPFTVTLHVCSVMFTDKDKLGQSCQSDLKELKVCFHSYRYHCHHIRTYIIYSCVCMCSNYRQLLLPKN